MFSLLESELSRGIMQAARARLRPPSPHISRLWEPSVSKSMPEVSRPCSSQGGERSGLDGARSSIHHQETGSLSPAQQTMVRGYVTGRSTKPSSSDVSGSVPGQRPPPPPDLGGDVQAFMQAKPIEDIPGPHGFPQSVPFAGTRLLFYPFTNYTTENMGSMLNKLQSNFGPIMRVKFGNQWVIIIENLDDIERLVRAAETEHKSLASSASENSGLFGKLRKRVEDSALSWLGWNHIERSPRWPKDASDGVPAWLQGNAQSQKLRADIAQYLNNQLTVDSYLSRQGDLAQDLVTFIEQLQHRPKCLQTLFYRYSIESVSQMCFNHELGLMTEQYQSDEEKQKLVESYRTVVKCLGETMTGTRILHMLFEDPFAKRFKDSKKVVNDWERSMMRQATVNVIRDKKSSKSPTSEDKSLLLALLDDKNLPEEDISNAMHALMTIGSDSVASTLQMLLYALATNVDKQEKLAKEILSVLGPDGQLNPTSLESMNYLKATVKESLRLHFPMAAGGRVILGKNIVLCDFLLPAGTPIVVNSRRTARNPAWFDHPHFFKPERWLGEEAKKIPKLAFMPFGFGANHCPSRAFSLQEINVALVKILQRYSVNLPSEYHSRRLETVYSLFLCPKEPLPFSFTLALK